MGISSSKSKTTPWGPAQPYILKGMQQTNDVFDANQPRLQDMSGIAYDAFKALSPAAFGTRNAYVDNAQKSAGALASGSTFGKNPGQASYDRLQSANTANGTGNNPASSYAQMVAEGGYLNAQPSANLYSTIMGNDYLRGNPYLDNVVAQTNEDVATQTNRMFGARGMGSGIGSAFADVLSKNLANNEGQLRYQNYNDAANRQLQAAGQSDNIWSGERGRMDAATGLLSANYNAAQDRALEAARSSDAAQQSQVEQMIAALSLTGDLRNAEYSGVAPALNLLNTAADIPYVGTAALNGQIRQASNGYGTTKVTGNIGSQLIDAGSRVASAYVGRGK